MSWNTTCTHTVSFSGERQTNTDHYLPSTYDSMIISCKTCCAGTLIMSFKRKTGAVVNAISLFFNNTDRCRTFQYQRGDTDRVSYQFIPSNPEATTDVSEVTITITSTPSSNAMAIHCSDGAPIDTTDNRLNVNVMQMPQLEFKPTSIKVETGLQQVQIVDSEATPLKTTNGALHIVDERQVSQYNSLNVGSFETISKTSVKLQSLTATNQDIDTCYLKLYNCFATPDDVSTQRAAATYVLFPCQTLHLTWAAGLDFYSGLSIACTTEISDSCLEFVSGVCNVHLSMY